MLSQMAQIHRFHFIIYHHRENKVFKDGTDYLCNNLRQYAIKHLYPIFIRPSSDLCHQRSVLSLEACLLCGQKQYLWLCAICER